MAVISLSDYLRLFGGLGVYWSLKNKLTYIKNAAKASDDYKALERFDESIRVIEKTVALNCRNCLLAPATIDLPTEFVRELVAIPARVRSLLAAEEIHAASAGGSRKMLDRVLAYDELGKDPFTATDAASDREEFIDAINKDLLRLKLIKPDQKATMIGEAFINAGILLEIIDQHNVGEILRDDMVKKIATELFKRLNSESCVHKLYELSQGTDGFMTKKNVQSFIQMGEEDKAIMEIVENAKRPRPMIELDGLAGLLRENATNIVCCDSQKLETLLRETQLIQSGLRNRCNMFGEVTQRATVTNEDKLMFQAKMLQLGKLLEEYPEDRFLLRSKEVIASFLNLLKTVSPSQPQASAGRT